MSRKNVIKCLHLNINNDIKLIEFYKTRPCKLQDKENKEDKNEI